MGYGSFLFPYNEKLSFISEYVNRDDSGGQEVALSKC